MNQIVQSLEELNKTNVDTSVLSSVPNIFTAYKKIKNATYRTQITRSMKLSELYNANVYLKREDLQVVGTYKVRGVYNKISSISMADRMKGITCASIGNHAQSVAYVCHNLKIHCTILMPTSTHSLKITSVQEFGKEYATIELFGDTFDEALNEALARSEKRGTVFVHAFDDEKIIEGQATIGVEILEDIPEKQIDVIIFPVGGGSCGAGIISYIKQTSPNTILIGAEPENSPSMHESLVKQSIVDLTKHKNYSDMTQVKKAGNRTFQIISQVLTDVLLIPEGHICSVMMKLFNDEGMLVERAGALAICGLEKIKHLIQGKTVVCLISGINSDLGKMNDIRMISEMYKGLQYYLFISFYTKPGALKQFFLECVGQNDEITNFDYTKKGNREKGPALVGLRVKTPDDFQQIKNKMNELRIVFKELNPKQEIFKLLL